MGSKNNISAGENGAILSLAALLSFRMLGLFLIFPVFALYAPNYQFATPFLIGIALGIYGLTQALLQLPLSVLSDYIGRKRVIVGGLILFAIGSTIAALASNIYVLILARALQGSGAIGSTLIALAADLTTVERRTKAMAILGMTIGASFGLAMILGPIITAFAELKGIFWLTSLFAIIGIFIASYCVPAPKKLISNYSDVKLSANLISLLRNGQILKLNFSIFLLHALLTASFVVMPFLLSNVGLTTAGQWKMYLPVLLSAFIGSLLLLYFAEKKHLIRSAIFTGIIAIALAEFCFFYLRPELLGLAFILLLFFTGFTLLEALLPSLISKLVSSEQKGTAMGFFSTFQFFGIFAGGTLAGLIKTHGDNHLIFFFATIASLVWLLLMTTLKPIPFFTTKTLNIDNHLKTRKPQELVKQLLSLPGVLEANVSIDDSIAYLKVDNKMFRQDLLTEQFGS